MGIISGTNATYKQSINMHHAGPYYYGSAIYCLGEDGTSTTGTYAAAVWKSTDGGSTWTEQDSANRPTYYRQLPTGRQCGFAVDREDGTDVLTVMVTNNRNTTSDAGNDMEFIVHTYDIAADTWGGALTTAAVIGAVNGDTNSFPMPFQMRLRSNGDIVLAYGTYTNSVVDKTYWTVYDGTSWGTPVSADTGTHTDNTCPVAMIRGSNDTMHLWMWSNVDKEIHHCALDSAGTAGTWQPSLIDVTQPSTAVPIDQWAVGQPATDGTRVMVPVLHGLTTTPYEKIGIIMLWGTSSTAPTWGTDTIISTALATDTAWFGEVYRGGITEAHNAAAVVTGGSMGVVWTGYDYVWYSLHDGTSWSTPSEFPSPQIPLTTSTAVADALNLSVAMNGSAFAVYGQAVQSVGGAAEYAWYKEFTLTTPAGYWGRIW